MFGAGGEILTCIKCTFIQNEASTYIIINPIQVFSLLWFQGFGVYNYANKFFRYEGEWSKGKKHGELIRLIRQFMTGMYFSNFKIHLPLYV